MRISSAIVALFIALVIGGCGSSSDSAGGTKTVVTVIEKAPPSKSDSGGSGSSEDPGDVSGGDPGGGGGGKSRVPNEVGNQLQAAQDDLQAHGFYNLSNKDATGQGRFLVYDRNWKVVAQDPLGGTRASEDTHITLRAKKYSDP
jgi:hypothetical protein